MKNEKPVLFNGQMVRAILEGRKTMTRRPMKVQPLHCEGGSNSPSEEFDNPYFVFSEDAPKKYNESDDVFDFSPFPDVGGNLWVRETFRIFDSSTCGCSDHCSCYRYHNKPLYRADNPSDESKWTPSIHMKREYSRINLRVKRVWVERIQDISEEDAKAEGSPFQNDSFLSEDQMTYRGSYRNGFISLWDSVYGTWTKNPFVWCCEFEVAE